jgi:hypothetical protein
MGNQMLVVEYKALTAAVMKFSVLGHNAVYSIENNPSRRLSQAKSSMKHVTIRVNSSSAA